MAYSAYGELLTGKVSGYGYNGEYYDAATGMLNLRARQYEPAQGRFSQRDSLKGWATSPRSLNAYLYCQNDAINYFDASGAAMVAVNMTDGGGGRTSSTSASPSSLFQKAGQTIKNVVSTAVSEAVSSVATAVKQVNEKVNPTAKSKGEAIVVSGKENDGRRFKYNFIESGIKGIKNYQAEGFTDITWIVFTYKYSDLDLLHFADTAASLGANFVPVNSNQEFINYLNTGNTSVSTGTRDRKITNMVIYGHGHPGDMELDEKEITEKELKQLNGAVFDNAKTVLYTCRGANSEEDTPAIAQTISNITHGETHAIFGRSEYAYIAYTKEEIESKKDWKNELLRLGTFYSLIKIRQLNLFEYGKYDELEKALEERMWGVIQSKLRDDEIEVSRKEFGYMQDGARYDPIPGKQAEDNLPEEKRKPSEWKTFTPTN